MTNEEVHKNLWRNSISNYVTMGLKIVFGLLMFRMLFQNLTKEEFGFWSLLWSVFGYGILLDFGFGFTAQKRVARQTIDRALDGAYEETSEVTLIDRAIAKRLRLYGRPADRQSAKRLFDHLMRLGFGYDLIVRKLRELQAEMEE